jgi:hypothetical protein
MMIRRIENEKNKKNKDKIKKEEKEKNWLIGFKSNNNGK